MMLSCIYLTRKCHRNCGYCRIRDSNLENPEMSINQWYEAFNILKARGVDFNLILGNEPLILKDNFVDLVKYLEQNHFSYGVYSTFPEPLWSDLRDKLVKVGLHNISCGWDYLKEWHDCTTDDIGIKSTTGEEGLRWALNNGIPDTHATITISKKNFMQLPELCEHITKEGHWIALNCIHYAKDSVFDFFPPKEEMEEYLLTEDDLPAMRIIAKEIKIGIASGKYKIQNPPEFMNAWLKHAINLDWHCTHPLILSVDADGSMRTCGYRPGQRISSYNILDLDNDETYEAFLKDWELDRKECPGCFWAYAWQAELWSDKNPEFGKKVFSDHASKHWVDEQ